MWEHCALSPQPGRGCVSLSSYMYFIGGMKWNSHDTSDKVSFVDTVMMKWQSLSPMPLATAHTLVMAIDRWIYAVAYHTAECASSWACTHLAGRPSIFSGDHSRHIYVAAVNCVVDNTPSAIHLLTQYLFVRVHLSQYIFSSGFSTGCQLVIEYTIY